MSTDSNSASIARTIKASEFKAKCLKLLDEMAENGEEIIITKNGRPTAKLVAYREKRGGATWPRQRHNLDTRRHRSAYARGVVRVQRR